MSSRPVTAPTTSLALPLTPSTTPLTASSGPLLCSPICLPFAHGLCVGWPRTARSGVWVALRSLLSTSADRDPPQDKTLPPAQRASTRRCFLGHTFQCVADDTGYG